MFTFPTTFFAGTPVLTGSTWNPADSSAFIAVSGGNLIATALGGGPGDSLIRGTLSKTTGKLYFEVQVTDRVDGETAIGLANSTENLNNFLGQTNNSIGAYKSGHVFTGGSQIAAGPAYAVNDFIGVAVDFGGNLFWFRNNGSPAVWNSGGMADPAAGLGGYDISPISGPFFICADIPVQPGVFTLNVGSTSFNVAAPTGFSAWG